MRTHNMGAIEVKVLELRKSCLLSILWITNPEHINREALNSAWVSKWKKQNKVNPTLKDDIIKPSCLRVEKATIFFKSQSILAITPANKIVMVDKQNNQTKLYWCIRWENRINKYTPAVTKVEEWTNDDTGVGAAMAAGSQEEKGIWALFVMKVILIKTMIIW